MRLVPEIGASFILVDHTVAMSDAMDISILLFILPVVRLVFLARNPRAYMGITRSLLPQNIGNLPLPFFGGNYSTVY